MFQPVMAAIAGRFSGVAAKDHVAGIAQFHRIQASPGFRQAAAWVHRHLADSGIQVETLIYAGDGRTFHLSYLSPPEWDAEAAELWLAPKVGAKRKLADYRDCKISLIQRSNATVLEGETVHLAVLEDGTEDEHYARMDVAGKLVLTANADLRRVRELAVDKYGAVGILYDGMTDSPPVRGRIDLPDARQYISFWPAGDERKPCWGFSLTPRIGDELRKLAREAAPDEPVCLWARVRAHFVKDGHIEVVSALIPGETDEEVMVVAHLCHPQPSANDNASGAGASLEMALTLGGLIKDGCLPKPRRGIRFLWVPEMTGTFAYLADHPQRISKTIAGINLDMVGQNQELCGSSFVVERAPRAMPSFVDDLMVRIREELTHESQSHSAAGAYALFRHAVTPFSGGSDHYVLSDPTVGIPCPMLIQWPDRFYHTSQDTIDKVDPASLYRAGVAAATYAYFVAAAGMNEAEWLVSEMLAAFKRSMATICQEAVTEAAQADSASEVAATLDRLRRRVAWETGLAEAGLATLKRLDSAVELARADARVAEIARQDVEDAESVMKAAALRRGWGLEPMPIAGELSPWETEAAGMVPVRRMRGPVNLTGHLTRLTAAEREDWRVFAKAHKADMRLLPDLALYWCDGQRTALEVTDAVELETGKRAAELVVRYFRLLHRLGLVDWA